MMSAVNTAEYNAALVLEMHGQQISVAVYQHGQEAIVNTLHALADLIDDSEFKFQADWIH